MINIQTTLIFILKVTAVISFARSPSFAKSKTNTNKNVKENFFSQRLDHFNPIDDQFWNQRYFVNEEFFDRNTTRNAFLYIGGEGRSNPRSIQGGTAYEAAKKYGGILFTLEHRFYGQSQPFENLTTANMRYLNSMQALNDLATFIVAMNDMYLLGKDVRWITVGGSYAGSLSAWMRLKYPFLVYGAVSSSGPLHVKVEFPEYLQVVSDDIALEGEECVENVNKAFSQLVNAFQNGTSINITTIFNLCTELKLPVQNKMDSLNLLEYLIDYNFAVVAQSYSSTLNMGDLCNIMNDQSVGEEIERLGKLTRYLNGAKCFEAIWEEYILDLKNVTIRDGEMMRQWWYQTCTEFGWYQVTDESNPAFGDIMPLEYFTTLCTDLYGDMFNESFIENKVKHSNSFYGGIEIDISNVVFLHGSLDPWHPVGLYEGVDNKSYSVIFIENAQHCSDLSGPSESDSDEIKYAKRQVVQLIGEWLEVSSLATSITLSKTLLFLGFYFSVRINYFL